MKHDALVLWIAVVALAVWLIGPPAASVADAAAAQVPDDPAAPAAPPTALGTPFAYQGQLRRGGAPHNGKCDFNFSLWDDATAGTQIGSTNAITGVQVVNGLFTVALDFDDVFFYEARWLKTEVKCAGDGGFTTLAPRQRVSPAPIALALPGLHTPQVLDAGGTPTVNVIGGKRNNAVSGPGARFSNVIAGGENNNIYNNTTLNAIAGGLSNTVYLNSDVNAIAGGQRNLIQAQSDLNAIGGGISNTISGSSDANVLAGGQANWILSQSDWNAIGGGRGNHAEFDSHFNAIGGGEDNGIHVGSTHNAIAGGNGNVISQTTRNGFIGAGLGNSIESVNGDAAIVAGRTNRIALASVDSIIGAGMNNSMVNDADFSAIGAGIGNAIAADATSNFIGAGDANRIFTFTLRSVIGGGQSNAIEHYSSDNVIGGGSNNTINQTSANSVIGGGNGNVISNQAQYSTIPGGQGNVVTASYALAAGRMAQAVTAGSFVWGDSQNAPVSSLGPDEFVVRAQGGLRLPGAGVNTLTSMFIHPFGPCPNGFPAGTPILNPLTLGRPGAILVVTPFTPGAAVVGAPPLIGPLAVTYDAAGVTCGVPGTWVIYNQYGGMLNPAVLYNVFVINP